MVLYGARDTLLAQYVHLHVLYGPHNHSVLCETLRVKDFLHSQDNTKQAPKIFATLKYQVSQCLLLLANIPVQELLHTS